MSLSIHGMENMFTNLTEKPLIFFPMDLIMKKAEKAPMLTST